MEPECARPFKRNINPPVMGGTFFFSHLLTKGGLICANTKLFVGLNSVTEIAKKSDVPSQYTHPSTKQCNYSVPIIDNLTSSSTTSALSANQGRILQAAITSKLTATTVFNGQFSGSTNIGNTTIFKLFSFNFDIVSGYGQYTYIRVTFSNALVSGGRTDGNAVNCTIRFPFIGLVMNLNEMYGICSAFYTDADGSVIFSKSPSYITSVSCGGGDGTVASGSIIGYSF